MKHIIIIGNGFDLSLGYKTSFKDFTTYSKAYKNAVRYDILNKHRTIFSELEEKSYIENWIDFEFELGQIANDPDVSFNLIEFQKFKTLLKNYLKSIQFGQVDFSTGAYEFMDAVYKYGQEYLIINFNYTNTVEDVLKSITNSPTLNPNIKIVNIHGSLSFDEIIIGVDDNLKLAKKDIFLRKAYSKLYTRIDLESELKQAKNVFIFGHSLGITDHPRLKPLIDDILNRTSQYPRNLVITYHGNDDRHEKQYMLDILTENNLTKFKGNCIYKEIDTWQKNIKFYDIIKPMLNI